MRFSQTTLLAILATSAAVSAAPAVAVSENALVTRANADEVLNILNELKQTNEKRDMSPEEEAVVLAKRDSLLVDLVAALENSGIISDVWNTLTQDEALRSEIAKIVKQTIQAALVEGPALIKAIFNSGIVGKVLSDVINDPDLIGVLLRVAKALFNSAANLFKAYTSGRSGSNTDAAPATDAAAVTPVDTATIVAVDTAAAAAPAATGSAGSGDGSDIPSAADYNAGQTKRDDLEYLDKRATADLVLSIVNQIKNSGLVSGLIKKVMANPDQAVSFLSKAFNAGIVAGRDVFNWAKQSGLLEKGLNWLETNGGKYAGTIASFLGGQLENGKISSSDIDKAGSTTPATTAAAAAKTAAPPAPAGAPATTLKQVRRAY